MATSNEIIQAVTLLAEQYRQQDRLNDGLIDLWVEVLGEYDASEIRAATTACIRTQKFFPTLAEYLPHLEKAGEVRRERDDGRAAYWRAMSNITAWLGGSLDDDTLERQPDIRWLRKQQARHG